MLRCRIQSQVARQETDPGCISRCEVYSVIAGYQSQPAAYNKLSWGELKAQNTIDTNGKVHITWIFLSAHQNALSTDILMLKCPKKPQMAVIEARGRRETGRGSEGWFKMDPPENGSAEANV